MIKTVYSEADQARVDAAQEAIDDHTSQMMKRAKESGVSARDTLRMVVDDKARRLMLKSLTAMTATMIPLSIEINWR